MAEDCQSSANKKAEEEECVRLREAEEEECVRLRAVYDQLARQNDSDLSTLTSRVIASKQALAQGRSGEIANTCEYCGVLISRRLQCGRCMNASYCCKEHQVAAWPAHKMHCNTPTQERAPTPPALPPSNTRKQKGSAAKPDTRASELSDPEPTSPTEGSHDILKAAIATAASAPAAPPAAAPQADGVDTSRLVDHAHTASPAGVRNEENRIKMLRLWSKLRGSRAQVTCYGRTRVRGVFESTDAEQEVLLMTAVETPMGTYPRALIRRSDVLAIDF